MEDEQYELSAEYMRLYNEFFALAIKNCSDFTGVTVASTMLGIAMRLYKTSLTEEDFELILSKVIINSEEIRPYTAKDFNSPTMH